MFFKVDMEHTVRVHPRYFGRERLESTVRKMLTSEMEGKFDGVYGYVIHVFHVENVGNGMIEPGEFLVAYPMKFSAVVFRPFRGQVLDAVVTQVNKMGIFATIGPVSCFISRSCLLEDVEFDANSKLPCFRSTTDGRLIQTDSDIRLRISGVRKEHNAMFTIGTLEAF